MSAPIPLRLILALAMGLAAWSPADLEAAPDPVEPAAIYKDAVKALKAGKKVKAAETLEKFLLAAGDKVGGFADFKRKKTANKKLDRLRARLSSLTLTCPVKGTMLLINTKHRGDTPLPHRLYLWPGKHKLELVKKGHVTVFKEVALKRGQHLELELKLPRVAVVVKVKKGKGKGKRARKAEAEAKAKARGSSEKTEGTPIYKKWWFWTAVGAVVVVTGVTAGVMANQPGEEPELGVIRFQ